MHFPQIFADRILADFRGTLGCLEFRANLRGLNLREMHCPTTKTHCIEQLAPL